jgi:hypothetical protein
MKKPTMCPIWRAALDRVRAAEAVAANTRQRWTALFAALDRRAHAHNALELAIDECRAAAKDLAMVGVPLATDALRQARANAEAAAHDELRAAKHVLAAIEAN